MCSVPVTTLGDDFPETRGREHARAPARLRAHVSVPVSPWYPELHVVIIILVVLGLPRLLLDVLAAHVHGEDLLAETEPGREVVCRHLHEDGGDGLLGVLDHQGVLLVVQEGEEDPWQPGVTVGHAALHTLLVLE